MGVDYSSLNPQSTLSLDAWSAPEISLISDVVAGLQAGTMVSYDDLDTSTAALRDQLNHPTYGQQSQDIIEAMYNLNEDPAGQAHVLGNILMPENLDMVQSLLEQPNSPLVAKLGPERSQLLMEIAGMPDEHARAEALSYLAQNQDAVAIKPSLAHIDIAVSEDILQQGQSEDVQSWLVDGILTAIQSGDAAAIGNALGGIPQSSLPILAQEVSAALGRETPAVLTQLVTSSDPKVSSFAFSVLAEQESAHAETQIAQDANVEAPSRVNTLSLEQMLMAPASTPATLAKQFAGASNFQACLLELMVR